MAGLYRDAYGVPHLRAGSVLDLAHGQGEVTARDRAWQLEHQRRRATGTLAEVLGPDAVPWDRFARRARIVDTAERALAALSAEARAFVTAYVDGVNAGLHGDAPELVALGVEPARWEPWTPLAVFLGQHLLFGSFPGKVWEHRAREVLGPEGAALLAHEGPAASGSNAWAVGGARTAGGFPLVAGDPHRTFESPGVYQQVRLACTDPGDSFDVIGFTFPGVPGVQHFAHAGGVAWAITNAVADYQDLYAEQVRRGDHGRVEARGPDGWEPADARVETIAVRGGEPVEVEVVATPRGVVVHEGLALRTASWVLGDLGFEALLPLLRARTVDDVDRALDSWVEPVNNVVMADRGGTVRYRVAGRVPVRAEANRHGIVDAADPSTAWTGWVDPLPREEVAADGCVVTANERRGPESDTVGPSFAPPHRADRLRALVGERTDLASADFAAFHADTAMPEPLLALVGSLLAPLSSGPVRDAILAWDGRMEADSGGAAAFAAWRSALVRRLAAEPVFAPLAEPAVDEPVLLPWLDPLARVGGGLESLLAAGSPFGIDLSAHAAAALRDAEDHPDRWGDTHVLTTVHAFDVHGGHTAPTVPPVPLGGDADCVRCTGGLDPDHAAWRGSVARYVWDLADPAGGGWVVPLGSSADPGSPHHADQLPLWTDVRLAPLVRDWRRLTFTREVPGLGTLTLDRFDPAADAATLHAWVREERAQFWMMRDHDLDEVRAVYEWIDEQPTHHAWWVRLDGEPAALFQDYDPRAEEVGDHVEVRPGDLGVHFMMAPASTRRAGFTEQVTTFVLDFAFADPAVRRLVVEPDTRNEKSLALVHRLGMEVGPVVELSTKPAQVAWLSRAAYERLR